MSIPGGEQGQVKQQPQKNSHLTLSFLPVENVGGGWFIKASGCMKDQGELGGGEPRHLPLLRFRRHVRLYSWVRRQDCEGSSSCVGLPRAQLIHLSIFTSAFVPYAHLSTPLGTIAVLKMNGMVASGEG